MPTRAEKLAQLEKLWVSFQEQHEGLAKEIPPDHPYLVQDLVGATERVMKRGLEKLDNWTTMPDAKDPLPVRPETDENGGKDSNQDKVADVPNPETSSDQRREAECNNSLPEGSSKPSMGQEAAHGLEQVHVPNFLPKEEQMMR